MGVLPERNESTGIHKNDVRRNNRNTAPLRHLNNRRIGILRNAERIPREADEKKTTQIFRPHPYQRDRAHEADIFPQHISDPFARAERNRNAEWNKVERAVERENCKAQHGTGLQSKTLNAIRQITQPPK